MTTPTEGIAMADTRRTRWCQADVADSHGTPSRTHTEGLGTQVPIETVTPLLITLDPQEKKGHADGATQRYLESQKSASNPPGIVGATCPRHADERAPAEQDGRDHHPGVPDLGDASLRLEHQDATLGDKYQQEHRRNLRDEAVLLGIHPHIVDIPDTTAVHRWGNKASAAYRVEQAPLIDRKERQ